MYLFIRLFKLSKCQVYKFSSVTVPYRFPLQFFLRSRSLSARRTVFSAEN
jgi:hypothetical protein